MKKLYQEVFNEDGTIKLCGREKCSELIEALSGKYPEEDFGNKKTGMINVEKIKEYIQHL